MGKLTKIGLLVVFLGGGAAVGTHLYSLSKVSSLKKEAHTALDRLQMVRGGTTMSPSLVRQRVVERMKKIGVEVNDDVIDVRLERVSRDNLHELPKVDQAAVGFAGKLKNHEIEMWLLQVRFPVRLSHGWVSQRATIQRTFTIKGAVKVDLEEDGEGEGEEDLEGGGDGLDD